MPQIKTTLLFLLIISTATFAQDYDLNTYDFRYQKYRGLTTGFDLGSRGGQSFSSQQDTFAKDSTFNNNGFSSSSFNFNPTYFSFVNTDALQQSTNISLNINFNYDLNRNISSNFKDGRRRNSENDVRFIYNTSIAKYSMNDKFRSLSVYSQSDFGNKNLLRKVQDASNRYENDWGIGNQSAISLGFGKGRMNLVSDAVQAMFILEDLNLLNGTSGSDEQIEGIAQGITMIRNARYLDYRIGYKSQLKMLDSVLEANGVVKEKSIDYFTIISDNWLYANRRNRFSGNVWKHSATLGNAFEAANNSEKRDDDDYVLNRRRNIIPSIQLSSYYASSQQRSLYVQTRYDFGARSELEYILGNSIGTTAVSPIDADSLWNKRITSKTVLWTTALDGNYQYLFQPNTRNLWTVDVSSSIIFNKTLPNLVKDVNVNVYNLRPFLSVRTNYYHWFSPQLNLTISGNLYTNNRYDMSVGDRVYRKQQNTNLNYDFSASLVYQFY